MIGVELAQGLIEIRLVGYPVVVFYLTVDLGFIEVLRHRFLVPLCPEEVDLLELGGLLNLINSLHPWSLLH